MSLHYKCDLCSTVHETKTNIPKPRGWISVTSTQRYNTQRGQIACNIAAILICDKCHTPNEDNMQIKTLVKEALIQCFTQLK